MTLSCSSPEVDGRVRRLRVGGVILQGFVEENHGVPRVLELLVLIWPTGDDGRSAAGAGSHLSIVVGPRVVERSSLST